MCSEAKRWEKKAPPSAEG
ncbi:hypothetical protein TFKS16_1704 [Tannerella forsythia KS16]|nr:hypothetical protein TFKS16_1704 [Tannerella forsythia KS16]